jgi:DNA-nicking Smr family endonuclease
LGLPQVVSDNIVKKRLVESLELLAADLPLDSNHRDSFLSSLLWQHDFDIFRVQEILFNMIGMVESNIKLSSTDKQEMYRTARAPVDALRQEYRNAKNKLDSLWNTKTEEYIVLLQEVESLRLKLQQVQDNAARDLFERMNSLGGDKGVENKENDLELDFHGLHVNEAKKIFEELVPPILPVLRKVVLVTGRGAHSGSGTSVLKQELKKFVTQVLQDKYGLIASCQEMRSNAGCLLVILK